MTEIRILHLEDEHVWEACLDRLPGKDITYYPRFLRVQEEKGDGKAECFIYEDGERLILFPYIRRPLNRLAFANDSFDAYCDITTPYCYGGPIHNAGDQASASGLVSGFRQAFHEHALNSGVVSEFVRFHPRLQNQNYLDSLYDNLILHQQNVMVDLTGNEDALLTMCRPTFRRYIRKARGFGLSLQQEKDLLFCEDFATLYGTTMARHKQTGYLNFSKDYFRALFTQLSDDVVVFSVRRGARIAAAAVFLTFGDYMDYFPGASDIDLFPYYPNHLLFYEASCWAHRQGFDLLHLGGGKKPLLYFKRGFSKVSEPFYIGQTVHSPDMYTALNGLRDAWQGTGRPWGRGFSPDYRRGLG